MKRKAVSEVESESKQRRKYLKSFEADFSRPLQTYLSYMLIEANNKKNGTSFSTNFEMRDYWIKHPELAKSLEELGFRTTMNGVYWGNVAKEKSFAESFSDTMGLSLISFSHLLEIK